MYSDLYSASILKIAPFFCFIIERVDYWLSTCSFV